ncbi:MAG TPA: hypothetical protein VMF53_11915 [Alphaproteobacteria bacterium]|nr:hypothetical protein [Alphaproteobacteria bacterium]
MAALGALLLLGGCLYHRTDAELKEDAAARLDVGKLFWVAPPHHMAVCRGEAHLLDQGDDCDFVGGGPFRVVGVDEDTDGRVYYRIEFPGAVAGYVPYIENDFFRPSGPNEIDVLQSDAPSVKGAKPPVPCNDGKDCDAKWARARAWIEYASHFPLVSNSATLLATSGPVYNSRYPAFIAQRIRGNAGLSWIFFDSHCAVNWNCAPTLDALTASFARFVGGG